MEKGGGRKKNRAVLWRSPRESGTKSKFRIRYRMILLHFPVLVTRIWASHRSVISQRKSFSDKKEKKKEKKVKRKKILRAKLVKLRPPQRKKLKIMALFPGDIAALRIYIKCRPKATIIRPGSSLGKGRICWDTRGVYCCLVVCFRSIHTEVDSIRVLQSPERSYYTREAAVAGGIRRW